MTNMQTAELIPVSQWIYNLYKVTYFRGDPDAGGMLIKTVHITGTSDSHVESDASWCAPQDECYYKWEVVKENVGHPRVVGKLYGTDIYETGYNHGQRLAGAM